MDPSTRRLSTLWVYLLPLLHLGACVTIALANLESGLEYMIYVDFPCSVLLVVLGWRHGNFLLWFATLGTLWWYLLSYSARLACNRFMAGTQRRG